MEKRIIKILVWLLVVLWLCLVLYSFEEVNAWSILEAEVCAVFAGVLSGFAVQCIRCSKFIKVFSVPVWIPYVLALIIVFFFPSPDTISTGPLSIGEIGNQLADRISRFLSLVTSAGTVITILLILDALFGRDR